MRLATTESTITELVEICHGNSKEAGWYTNLQTGEPLKINDGERLMLIVSEISEAMEGLRKKLMDDKLSHRPMAEVELADACIRIFDYAGHKGYDLIGAIVEKIYYNIHRDDHKLESRKAEGGKGF